MIIRNISYFSIHASAKEATQNGRIYDRSRIFFNPRLREGGDLLIRSSFCYCIFSIHASAKEATSYNKWCNSNKCFQSTPPRRRRPKPLDKMKRNQIFQSTPPRRRRLFSPILAFPHFLFQSTPPRRRRRQRGLPNTASELFSIHASAKEATSRTNF